MTIVLIRRREKRDHHGKTEEETGAELSQVKEYLGIPEAGRDKEESSP